MTATSGQSHVHADGRFLWGVRTPPCRRHLSSPPAHSNELGKNVQGHDTRGYDTRRYDPRGHDVRGCDARGYDAHGYDARGYNPHGHELYIATGCEPFLTEWGS